MSIAIDLTQGYVAIIDEMDADLADLKWHVSCTRRTHQYAMRTGYVRGSCTPDRPAGHYAHAKLHGEIAKRLIGRGLVKGEVVDHINHDTLDNRRSNLRVITQLQNAYNATMRTTNAIGYKGVFLHKQVNKWRAVIKVNGKRKHLGCFDSVIDAAIAYDRACYELHGEFACANYPRFACGLGGA